jgi:hypothetical protein
MFDMVVVEISTHLVFCLLQQQIEDLPQERLWDFLPSQIEMVKKQRIWAKIKKNAEKTL